MTLIAAVGLETYPAIFGDLLASGATRAAPARGDATAADAAEAAPGSPWSLPELDQKLALLGDNCVIAWAGDAAFARIVISELRSLARESPLSMAAIDGVLSRLDPARKDLISLVGWVRDNGVFHQFWYRADIARTAMFGQMSAGGSAATEFVKLAARVSQGPMNVRGEVLRGLERAVTAMLSATSLLLQAELSGQRNLLRHFGDGYEIATFVGGRFAKLGDMAFVYWKADVSDGQASLSGPEFILKQDYAGEVLLLRALRMRAGNTSSDEAVLEEARRAIPPFGSVVDALAESDIAWPAMEATFTCHVVLVRSRTDFAVVNRIEYSQSRTPRSIRFELDNGRVPFGVNQEFLEELRQSAEAGLPER
jgi:hypothetical protein